MQLHHSLTANKPFSYRGSPKDLVCDFNHQICDMLTNATRSPEAAIQSCGRADICKYHQPFPKHRQSCEALGINDIRTTNTHKQKNVEWGIMIGKVILSLESAIANNSPATEAFKSEWAVRQNTRAFPFTQLCSITNYEAELEEFLQSIGLHLQRPLLVLKLGMFEMFRKVMKSNKDSDCPCAEGKLNHYKCTSALGDSLF